LLWHGDVGKEKKGVPQGKSVWQLDYVPDAGGFIMGYVVSLLTYVIRRR